MFSFLKSMFNSERNDSLPSLKMVEWIRPGDKVWQALYEMKAHLRVPESVATAGDAFIKKNLDSLALGKSAYINVWPLEGLQPDDYDALFIFFAMSGFIVNRSESIVMRIELPASVETMRPSDLTGYRKVIKERSIELRYWAVDEARRFVYANWEALKDNKTVPLVFDIGSRSDHYKYELLKQALLALDLFVVPLGDGANGVTAVDPSLTPTWVRLANNKPTDSD